MLDPFLLLRMRRKMAATREKLSLALAINFLPNVTHHGRILLKFSYILQMSYQLCHPGRVRGQQSPCRDVTDPVSTF